jgi:hypothetical protein
MKIRHPAAIILITWYIMFPPLVTRSGVVYMEPNVAAPLTEWRQMQLENGTKLDSESVCEDTRSTMVSKTKNLLADAPTDLEKMPLENNESAGNWVFALEAARSRCIASDDPRLKTN